jgi:hypothetical protein
MNKYFLLVALCVVSSACHSSKVEPRSAAAPAPATKEPVYKPGLQPTEAELREAIKRNYEDAVTIDNNRSQHFLVGDFNGDNSEDIAVVVRPGKGKLRELNGEYVNWILDDLHRPKAISIGSSDVLLAVIHGHEREGWRNTMARQTYLLKNAVGDEFMKQAGRELNKNNKALPRLLGDVIREKLDGTAGIIFWTGAKYAWHPVI